MDNCGDHDINALTIEKIIKVMFRTNFLSLSNQFFQILHNKEKMLSFMYYNKNNTHSELIDTQIGVYNVFANGDRFTIKHFQMM